MCEAFHTNARTDKPEPRVTLKISKTTFARAKELQNSQPQ